MDERRPSPRQLEMAFRQARHVSASRIGSTIMGVNANKNRLLNDELKMLEKNRAKEWKALSRMQDQLRKDSPDLKRKEERRYTRRALSVDTNIAATPPPCHRQQGYLDALASPGLSRRHRSLPVGIKLDGAQQRSSSLPRIDLPKGSPRASEGTPKPFRPPHLPSLKTSHSGSVPDLTSLDAPRRRKVLYSPLVPRKSLLNVDDYDTLRSSSSASGLLQRTDSPYIQNGDFKSDPRFQKFEAFVKATKETKKKNQKFEF
eukprot:m.15875 g.15875  ORF g.15875 m.15875 type:complete len:259 (+) comp26594_c0_seq2:26-802(+)